MERRTSARPAALYAMRNPRCYVGRNLCLSLRFACAAGSPEEARRAWATAVVGWIGDHPDRAGEAFLAEAADLAREKAFPPGSPPLLAVFEWLVQECEDELRLLGPTPDNGFLALDASAVTGA
jgi:hypothetical protein